MPSLSNPSSSTAVVTTTDPRSRRPTKKRALSPTSAQAATVSALFAKPDQEIRIPPLSSSTARPAPAPPEIVSNVQGSSAGAGSGEFHVYKASRRREYDRLRRMDEEVDEDTETAEFVKKKTELARKDVARTDKKREERKKRKQRKLRKKARTDNVRKGDAAEKAKNTPNVPNGGSRQRNDAAAAQDLTMTDTGMDDPHHYDAAATDSSAPSRLPGHYDNHEDGVGLSSGGAVGIIVQDEDD